MPRVAVHHMDIWDDFENNWVRNNIFNYKNVTANPYSYGVVNNCIIILTIF